MGNKEYYSILVLLILASLSFYSPNIISIPQPIYKFIFYGLSLLFMLGATIKKRGLIFFDIAFVILFVCQIISVYNAYYYSGQAFSVGFVAMLQNAAYILYPFLRKSDISLKSIAKIIKLFAICYMIISVVNRALGFPLFGKDMFDAERGGVRYIIPGIHWVVLFLYSKVNDFSIRKRKADGLWILACLISLLLSLTRQVILVSLMMSFFIYMRNVSFKKKVIVVVFSALIALFVLPKIGLVQALINKTIQDIEAQGEYDNIRIVAFLYFAFDYPRSTQEVLFGCGIPSFGKSKYGLEYINTTSTLKVFREDVGWAGFYYNFGIVSVAILLLIFLMALRMKLPPNYLYLKYYIGSVILLSIASAPILYNDEILVIIICLYAITKANEQNRISTYEIISNNNTRI